jgi:hypothetical protein
MKEIESTRPDVKVRRKLLAGAGIGLLSLLSFFKSGIFSKKNPVISCAPPPEKKETIKVLSQDGRLVEVDVSKIKRLKEKISDEELKNWIKKG